MQPISNQAHEGIEAQQNWCRSSNRLIWPWTLSLQRQGVRELPRMSLPSSISRIYSVMIFSGHLWTSVLINGNGSNSLQDPLSIPTNWHGAKTISTPQAYVRNVFHPFQLAAVSLDNNLFPPRSAIKIISLKLYSFDPLVLCLTPPFRSTSGGILYRRAFIFNRVNRQILSFRHRTPTSRMQTPITYKEWWEHRLTI